MLSAFPFLIPFLPPLVSLYLLGTLLDVIGSCPPRSQVARKLIILNRLLFMHSIAYNYAPQTFANTWLTNAVRNTGHDLRNADFFVMPQVRIDLFRRFPLNALPHEWNNLGDKIRLQHNRTTFKIALTDFLLGTLLENQNN